MNQQPQTAEGPASLNPRSAGCILTAVAILAAIVAGWLGLRLLRASSGDMALAAARNGVATSGLGAETRGRLEAQLRRVEGAHHAGELTPAQVIEAVNGLLQTPCLPALRLQRVLEVDLAASGLTPASRGELAAALASLRRRVEAGEITVGALNATLDLAPATPGEAAAPLGDLELEAILTRAREVLAEGPPPAVDAASDPPDPVEVFGLHVDRVLEGSR